MAGYGITQDGFTIKGIDVIIGESMDRARQVFGDNVDLTATSPLRKILEMAALEDANLWKTMDDLYYSNFISTAIGNNLDLLGEDLGQPRQPLFAQGNVTIKIDNPVAGRQYTFPVGTILVTANPAISFGTLVPLTLSTSLPQASVAVQALQRGPNSNIPGQQITGIEQGYQDMYLSLGGTTITITQNQAFTGGEVFETDDAYRVRILGLPRNIWTLESVQSAVLALDGVTDVLVSDPLAGVEASQSYFSGFKFSERHFSGQRRVNETYFFDIVVAHLPAWPWETQGPVKGVYDRVRAATDLVRPIGIHPNIFEAVLVEVGVRATLLIEPGSDPQTLLAAIKQRIANDIGVFKLGNDVRFSQVVRAFTVQPGVIDVQNLHLRRYPGSDTNNLATGTTTSAVDAIEMAVGANVVMLPHECPVFRLDSTLISIEVKS